MVDQKQISAIFKSDNQKTNKQTNNILKVTTKKKKKPTTTTTTNKQTKVLSSFLSGSYTYIIYTFLQERITKFSELLSPKVAPGARVKTC